MRDIRFRAWTGLEMEYRVVVGQLGAFYVAGLDPQDSASMSNANTIYSKETPIMQFTGLKDKNGKEIYEGDILGRVENRDFVCEVMFTSGSFKGLTHPGKNHYRLLTEMMELDTYPYVEVIGNIHENPELLNPLV